MSKDWQSIYRDKQNPTDAPPYLLTMGLGELDKWLSLFVLEVRRKDGNVYPPIMLWSVVLN